MTTDNLEALAAALQPLISRVRTDVTAVKRESGRQAWTREALTPDRLRRHLNGGPARGVGFIKPGESVTLVGMLDFDSHGGETDWPTMSRVVIEVADTLELAFGMSPILFRSSGGRGVHLYVLFDEPQDAYSIRMLLADALIACGLKSGTKGVMHGEVEVFPRQDDVPVDGWGNQVVMPLAAKSVPLAIEREVLW